VRRTAIVLLASLAVGPAAGAQRERQPLPPPGRTAPSPAPADEPRPLAPLEPLLELPGEYVEVRYVAETLDRAARFQARLETLHQLWQPMTPRPLDWRGATVTEEIWRRLDLGRPWGVAARAADGTFVAPAYGDAGTVATVETLLGGPVPAADGMPFFGNAEEAGSLAVCDALLQLEAAHAFVDAAGLRGDEPWIQGLLAHLAARAAWQAVEPDRVLEIVGWLDRVAAAHGGPRAQPLAGYGAAQPFERGLWYEAQLVRGADVLWVEEGRRGSARRLGAWIRRGKPVTRAELEKRYPGLIAWRLAAFPD
jgi:hypothetical protein